MAKPKAFKSYSIVDFGNSIKHILTAKGNLYILEAVKSSDVYKIFSPDMGFMHIQKMEYIINSVYIFASMYVLSFKV